MTSLWTASLAAQLHPPALDESTWSINAHGFATLNYRNDGGLRGASDLFSTSTFMFTSSGPMLGGSLELRTMGSLDPIMGRGGYPLLYQTGETADGLVPLVDRQHPHDALIELGVEYTLTAQTFSCIWRRSASLRLVLRYPSIGSRPVPILSLQSRTTGWTLRTSRPGSLPSV